MVSQPFFIPQWDHWSHLANTGLLCLCMCVSQQEEEQQQQKNVAEVDLQFFTVALNHG